VEDKKRRGLLFSNGGDEFSHHFLAVTIEHESVGCGKEWVGDTGKSGAQTSLNDHHCLSLIHIEDGHAIDGARNVLACRWVDHVIGPNNQ
jgi:hypothetical protein